MGPCAVDCKLDLTPKAVGYILKADLPNIFGDLGHLVCYVSGIPVCAVEPVAFAVTNSVYCVILKLCDEFYDLACYFNISGIFINSRMINDGEGACFFQIESYIVVGLIADPFCAVYNSLQLNCVVRLVNSVFLCVSAVRLLCHQVVFVGCVPTCAKDLRLGACYDDCIICGFLYGEVVDKFS